MAISERVYSTVDLVQRWQCSPDLVYRLLESGELRGFKIGRWWRITEAAVHEFENTPGEKTKYNVGTF